MNKKALTALLLVLLIVTLGSLWYFLVYSKSAGRSALFPIEGSDNQPVAIKQVTNYLTGELLDEDKAPWVNNRPLAVMVNNHVDARPQSGLVEADLVYEVVAEGGITRYLTFFLSAEPEKIGPVRSTREYYLVLVRELADAMLMHIGYSPQALVAIETWPVRSLARGGASFWRDTSLNVATEHTAYVNGKELRELGDSLGWEGKPEEFVMWQFKDDENKPALDVCGVGECNKPIEINFWYKGDYSGIFEYDRNTNLYSRYTGYDQNGNKIQLLDRDTGRPVRVKNVIVQFATENSIPGDDSSRLEYELLGSGDAYVFLDGRAINATWSKADRDSRTTYYDESGKEIEFNRGKFWISIVPDRNKEQVLY